MRPISGIQIAPNADGTIAVQIERSGYTLERDQVFFTRPDPRLLIAQLRLVFLAGGFKDPAGEDFLAAVRARSAKAGGATYHVAGIVAEDAAYRVDVVDSTGREFGVVVESGEFTDPSESHDPVLYSIGLVLLAGGYRELTEDAIAAVRAATFWIC